MGGCIEARFSDKKNRLSSVPEVVGCWLFEGPLRGQKSHDTTNTILVYPSFLGKDIETDGALHGNMAEKV